MKKMLTVLLSGFLIVQTNIILPLLFTSTSALAVSNGATQVQPDPVVLLKDISARLIAGLKKNQADLKTNPQAVYDLANSIIVPHADINEMAQRVIPPQIWQKTSATLQAEFKQQFTTLLVRTYSAALAAYSDEEVKFYPIRGGYQGKANVQVDCVIIQPDGPQIPVSYRLSRHSNRWLVYDLIVDGVSLLQSFRSQFADQLANGNMADLVKQLTNHNQNAL